MGVSCSFFLFQNFSFEFHRLENKGFILLTHTSLYTFYILSIEFHRDFLLKLLLRAYMADYKNVILS